MTGAAVPDELRVHARAFRNRPYRRSQQFIRNAPSRPLYSPPALRQTGWKSAPGSVAIFAIKGDRSPTRSRIRRRARLPRGGIRRPRGGIASLIIERARRIRRFTAFAQCRSGCLATQVGRPSTSCFAAVVGGGPDLTRPAAYRRATPRRAALARGRLSGALQPRLPFLR